jgi:hypothetical protein
VGRRGGLQCLRPSAGLDLPQAVGFLPRTSPPGAGIRGSEPGGLADAAPVYPGPRPPDAGSGRLGAPAGGLHVSGDLPIREPVEPVAGPRGAGLVALLRPARMGSVAADGLGLPRPAGSRIRARAHPGATAFRLPPMADGQPGDHGFQPDGHGPHPARRPGRRRPPVASSEAGHPGRPAGSPLAGRGGGGRGGLRLLAADPPGPSGPLASGDGRGEAHGPLVSAGDDPLVALPALRPLVRRRLHQLLLLRLRDRRSADQVPGLRGALRL